MGLFAAAVCIEVGELFEQVCGTEMLPGLELSNRLQQENFSSTGANPAEIQPPLLGGEESTQRLLLKEQTPL